MKLTLSIPLFAMLASCSPVLYTPVGQNVPFFKEKGEVVLSAGACGVINNSSFSGNNSATGLGFQGATAVSNTVAVIGSFYAMKAGEDNNAQITGKGNYFEAGIGKFKYWPAYRLHGEVFGGLGFGSIKNLVNQENVEARYFKPFLQPSIGYGSAIVDFAFTPKLVMIQYTSTVNNLTDPAQHQTVEDFFSKKKSSFVCEPGFTIRLGWKDIKLQYQACYTYLSYTQTEEFAPINNLFESITLYFKIPKRALAKPAN